MNTSKQFYRHKGSSEIRPRPRHVLMSSLLCALLMTAACGGSNVVGGGARPGGATTTAASEPSIAKINVCALVTKTDAESILGDAVKPAEDAGSGGCGYEIADDKGGMRIGVLSVSLETDGKMAFDMHRKMSGVAEELTDVARNDEAPDQSRGEAEKRTDGKTQWLSGIGDKAYMSSGFRGGMMDSPVVSVLKGDTWILVQAHSNLRKGSEDALKAAAKKVADAV